jgi:hypothetical protein
MLSKMQRRAGNLPASMNFLQFAVKKIFHREINLFQSRLLDYSFVGLALAVALIK